MYIWQNNHNIYMHKIPIPTFWYTIVCIYMCRCIDVTISMYIYPHWQNNHNTYMPKIPIPTLWYTIVCLYICRCIDVTISVYISTHWQNNHNIYMHKIPIPTFWYTIVCIYMFTLKFEEACIGNIGRPAFLEGEKIFG